MAGSVEKVELRNFMSHRHLAVDFNPSVNFIVGQNGSGKSAILTALSVCLGCSAQSTQRAPSMKGLIREGESQATVTVVLRNSGAGAFHPEIYGERLTIERHFTDQPSASSYRIRDKDGRALKAKRSQVQQICAFFNHQIDNPLVNLSQETAKRFLACTSPAEMYGFFLRGTQLDQIAAAYEQVQERLNRMRATHKRCQTTLAALEQQNSQLERQVEFIERMQSLYELRDRLKHEMCWAQVQEHSSRLLTERSCLEQLQQSSVADLSTIAVFEHQIEEISNSVRSLNESNEQRTVAIAESDRQRDGLMFTINSAESRVNDAQFSMQSAERSCADYEQELLRFKQRIDAEREKQSNDNEAYVVPRMNSIRRLEGTLVDANQRIASSTGAVASISSRLSEVRSSLSSAQDLRTRCQHRIAELKRSISTLSSSKADASVLYGDRMPQLLQRIRPEKFSQPPIGPIGLQIGVKSARWIVAIEAVIGKVMDSFIVTTVADRQLLQHHLDALGLRNSIYTMSPKMMDRVDLPDPSITTIFSELEYNHELAKKLLVLICRINRVALVADLRSGHEVLRSPSLDYAFTAEGQRISVSSGSKSTFSFGSRGPQRLGVNPEDQLRQVRNQLHAKECEEREISETVARVEAEIRHLASDYTEQKRVVQVNEEAVTSATAELRRLKGELEIHEPISISELQKEQRVVEEQFSLMQKQVECARTAVQEFVDARDRAAQQLQQFSGSFEEQKQLLSDARKLLLRYIEEKNAITRQKQTLLSAHEGRQEGVAAQRVRCDELQKENDHKRGLALSVTESPIETKRPPAVIEKELVELQIQIETRERNNGDPEVILASYRDVSTRLRRIRSDLSSSTILSECLEKALRYRKKRWIEFRDAISIRSHHHFVWNLMHRNYTGRLEFDHENQTLDLRVLPNAPPVQGRTATPSDLRGLSGGEKSFSTVSFLLALWENVCTPIRCLDEFDVYMDSVNRAQIIQMIVEFARRNSRCQHIFVSPLGFDKVQGPDISVLRLRSVDPSQQAIF